MIEFAHWTRYIPGSGKHVVQSGGLVARTIVFGIRVPGIVRNLVLEADHILLVLGGPIRAPVLQGGIHPVLEFRHWLVEQEYAVLNAIFHAAVASRRDRSEEHTSELQ